MEVLIGCHRAVSRQQVFGTSNYPIRSSDGSSFLSLLSLSKQHSLQKKIVVFPPVAIHTDELGALFIPWLLGAEVELKPGIPRKCLAAAERLHEIEHADSTFHSFSHFFNPWVWLPGLEMFRGWTVLKLLLGCSNKFIVDVANNHASNLASSPQKNYFTACSQASLT